MAAKLAAKAVAAKTASGKSQSQVLIELLMTKKNYSMRTVDAMEALYPGDNRSEGKIKNSFASAKSRAWSDHNEKIEYDGDNVVITGQRNPDNHEEMFEYIHG